MSTTITTEDNLTADPELRFTKATGQAVALLPTPVQPSPDDPPAPSA